VPSRVLLVRPRGLFLALVALAGLGVPAGASAAVPAPTLQLLAGTGVPGYLGDGGPAAGAQLDQPMGVAVDAAGDVLVADLSNRIRKITPDGLITTVAGSGIAGFAGDGGPATNAQLNHPTGVVVDAAGGILIADQHNYRVRRVDPSGTITTIAGTGFSGYGLGDGGLAVDVGLNLPTTLALDAQGGILIAEMGERRIRRIDPDGTISTIAGDSGSGYDGDNKPATQASLTKPTGVAVTPTGDVLIADQGDQRVRRVDRSGVIHTIAGNGLKATTGDGGAASAATLDSPTSLLVDRSRRVLVTEANGVRSIERDGTINTVAGGGTSAPANGLLATSAALSSLTSMAIDRTGGVIVDLTGSNQLWTLLPARASL
jgi:NHL repeat